MKPVVTALAPWFGGKRNLAARIVALLGPHRCYWEPFCGSMAVLIAKPPASMETANDLHGDLVNLARVIQSPTWGPQLYRRLRRVWMNEAQFAECDGRLRTAPDAVPDDLGPEAAGRAFDYFVASWMGRNGAAGTPISHKGSYCVRFTTNGGNAAARWQSAVASIPAWRRRLARVTILRRDGFALLERIEDAAGTAIYVDPPYVVKGAKYLHDFAADDHERLAALLRRFRRARVVVSYYEHPDVRRLYDGWQFAAVEVVKALVSGACRQRGNSVKVTELLIHNGPAADLFG